MHTASLPHAGQTVVFAQNQEDFLAIEHRDIIKDQDKPAVAGLSALIGDVLVGPPYAERLSRLLAHGH